MGPLCESWGRGLSLLLQSSDDCPKSSYYAGFIVTLNQVLNLIQDLRFQGLMRC